jgi:hypothetical protein
MEKTATLGRLRLGGGAPPKWRRSCQGRAPTAPRWCSSRPGQDRTRDTVKFVVPTRATIRDHKGHVARRRSKVRTERTSSSSSIRKASSRLAKSAACLNASRTAAFPAPGGRAKPRRWQKLHVHVRMSEQNCSLSKDHSDQVSSALVRNVISFAQPNAHSYGTEVR